MAILHFQVNGQQASVKIEPTSDGYQVQIGENSYSVAPQEDNGAVTSFTVDEDYHTVYVVPGIAVNERQAWSDGRQWLVEKIDSRQSSRQRGRAQTESGVLTASMPGQVVQVLVVEGDLVGKGEPLVVLEAMKMEMRISAATDGKVTVLNCKVGDVVTRGQKLVTIGDS